MALIPQGMANPNVPMFQQNNPFITQIIAEPVLITDTIVLGVQTANEYPFLQVGGGPPGGEPNTTLYEVIINMRIDFENYSANSVSPIVFQFSQTTTPNANGDPRPLPPFNPQTDAWTYALPQYAQEVDGEPLLYYTASVFIRPLINTNMSLYMYVDRDVVDTATMYYTFPPLSITYRRIY